MANVGAGSLWPNHEVAMAEAAKGESDSKAKAGAGAKGTPKAAGKNAETK